MNALGAICFLGLFAVYAAGQEFSRRVAGIAAPPFFVRYFQSARKDLIGLMIGWVVGLLFASSQDKVSVAIPALMGITVVVLLINLVRVVELPKKQTPPAQK